MFVAFWSADDTARPRSACISRYARQGSSGPQTYAHNERKWRWCLSPRSTPLTALPQQQRRPWNAVRFFSHTTHSTWFSLSCCASWTGIVAETTRAVPAWELNTSISSEIKSKRVRLEKNEEKKSETPTMTNRLLFLCIMALASVVSSARDLKDISQDEKIMNWFATKVSCRVRPVVEHIQQTNAWKNRKTRDVLDWGAGGGLLASSLAKLGATSVVAVDINPVAVQAAQRRLEPFPHAAAIQGTNLNELPTSQTFDIIVSYQGALVDSTPGRSQRIGAAAKVCRDGGSIIVAQFPEAQGSATLQGIKGFGMGCALGFFLLEFRWNLFHMLRTALRMMTPWYLGYVAVKLLLAGLDTNEQLHGELLVAGFTNIRKTTKILLWPYQSLEQPLKIPFWLNLRMQPLILHIWEGTRHRSPPKVPVAVSLKKARRHPRKCDNDEEETCFP